MAVSWTAPLAAAGPLPHYRRTMTAPTDPAPAAPWRFCVAPMMDWTDRHCRVFHRLLSRRARLYTEMVTAQAVVRGDRQRLLGFSPVERPLALQLGGCEPALLAQAAVIGADWGYDEINLNVGCPSDRVQEGRFGACLMAEPALVADCVAAMRAAAPAGVEVTVKHRIGIDDQEDEAALDRFVATVAEAGCRVFLVHARKAWLSGLSPKENREIPPLRYELVHRLKARRPGLTVVLNGGLADLAQAQAHLPLVDGVMLGRAAYQDPWILAGVDPLLFGESAPAESRAEAVEALAAYAAEEAARGVPLKSIARHVLGLANGLPGARAWRRTLSEGMRAADAPPGLLPEAFALCREEALRPAAWVGPGGVSPAACGGQAAPSPPFTLATRRGLCPNAEGLPRCGKNDAESGRSRSRRG